MTGRRILTVWARASLRSRVLLLATALLAAGFTAFSLVTGNALRTYLEDRADTQLRAAAQVFALLPPGLAESGAERTPPAGLGEFSTEVLGNPVIAYVRADGTSMGSIDSLAGKRSGSSRGPRLPKLDSEAVAAGGGRPFTADSSQGEGRWRVIAVPRAGNGAARSTLGAALPGDGGSVVVATSMDQVDATVDRMWRVYETTGLALLGLLVAAGWFAMRSGLKPLSRIERTAAEIAHGDLTRRVPALAGPNTEVGRLATALNGMLGQIEAAFAARAESEARMGRFVADAGHELRTPLAGIKGLTDLYHMGALPEREDIDATMARIARESERLTRLVEDMLLLARLDEPSLRTVGGDPGQGAGSPDPFPLGLDCAPMDLRTLAADALHDIRALDAARSVTLTGPNGDGPPASAPALADESRLRQVVTNLIGNAIRHTPPGTPIRIGVGTDGGHAVLEVADEGPGLTEEQAHRIFERFYRADTSRTRATGGAGLGLAIVQSLVTAHAGHVDVRSAPGRGATFRVLLPPPPDPRTEPRTSVRPQAAASAAGAALRCTPPLIPHIQGDPVKRRTLLALTLTSSLAFPVTVTATAATPTPADEERSSRVTGVEVTRKESLGTFGGVPYERLAGTVSGTVSAEEPVAGLDSAAGTDGVHTYTSGFELIRPVGQDQRSEVVVEVENRGIPLLLHGYNSMQDPPPVGAPQDVSYPAGMGDGFLFAEGRSYARVQWQTGISPGVPESAQGVGQVIVRDFGRLLRSGRLEGEHSPLGAYEHRLLVGLSQASWFVTSFVAEGFNDAGGRVFQGAYAQDGTGNQLAINGVAAADGQPQVPYMRPDGVPLAPGQVLRRPATDPVFVDVAAYTDYYRLRASVSRQADPADGYHRYDWPAAHNPAISADAADTAFQRFGCNDGEPIPLSSLHSEPYGRALLVALERRLGIGGPREKMPPEQVFTAGARPADPALLNGLPGREVTVPRTDADGFPIGGVRFSAADLPLGSPVPPAVAPVSTASITAVCGNYGGWQPYTADELRRRYGSLDDYVSTYDARVTRLIASGLLLERDRGLLLDRASEEWSKAPTGS